jgi:hypothetical protein
MTAAAHVSIQQDFLYRYRRVGSFSFFSFSRWGWPLDWILSHSNTHDNNQFRRELISLPIELF